jgi:hypothetical protein
MRNIILGFLIIWLGGIINAQTDNKLLVGKVSYISSQNVYVKFESTKNIQVGDTLFLQKDNKYIPALIVSNLSSTSCVCNLISKTTLTVSFQVYAISHKPELAGDKVLKEVIPSNRDTLKVIPDSATENTVKKTRFKQKISGNITATSYSYNSTITDVNPTRYQYSLSVNARNIGNSMLSAECYASFRHEKDKWELVQQNMYQALKVYNLSVKFDNDKNTKIVLGRKTNPKVSNIGAVDGIQYEGKMNNYFIGAFAGSRPNYKDYGIDFNLPQFGAYLGHNYMNSKGEMQNTLAIVEQMNETKTDRRFAYFQHSNTLIKNLYFFGTVEFDLYKNIDNKPENTINRSSIYMILNYKLLKRLTLSTSFDIRENVIYYETYKSYINQLLEIEARKGLSFQANYRTPKYLMFGFKTGYRFPNSNSKETRNLYGYITFSNIPAIKLTTTISANYLETSYVNGKIFNVNLNRDFFKGVLYTDCGYQLVDYSYSSSDVTTMQHIINLSINLRILRNNTFSVNYEKTFEKQDQLSRMTFQIRLRF